MDHGRSGTIQFATSECSLGIVLVAATPRGVCAVLLGDDRKDLTDDLRRRFPRATFQHANSDFVDLLSAVIRIIDDRSPHDLPPLDPRGTPFQKRVWQALAEIPRGQTRSYSDLARALGSPGSVRAVAGACAANHMAVVIPCHRAIRRDGDLAGYHWGIERKRVLLAREVE